MGRNAKYMLHNLFHAVVNVNRIDTVNTRSRSIML